MNNVTYISGLVERARAAQKIAESFTQRQVDEAAAAIVYSFSRPELAQSIARDVFDETRMGDYQSKVNKLVIKMPRSFYYNLGYKTVGVIEENKETGIVKIAKPVGVIAALIPSTNPEATPVFKGMLSLRGRNAVICAPHPKSKKSTVRVVNIMREILKRNNMPEDLFIVIEEPSKDLSQELMRQCDLTFATGGRDMVRAAYSSGKPAYGVGTGNCPSVIDETADLADAAHKVMLGKIGDNASGCSAENSLIVQEGVYDELMGLLQAEGGYLATPEEKEKIQKVHWINGDLNREVITQSAATIAKLAGIAIPENTKFIMVEETGIGKDYPFSGEKLSLVLTVYKYGNFDEAIHKAKSILEFCGLGHSCNIHSFDDERILRYALETKTVRVTVRQPNGTHNSGMWDNGLPDTFAVGCGTWGGNIISESVSQKHFINTTWLAMPINRCARPEKEIFGDLLKNAVLYP